MTNINVQSAKYPKMYDFGIFFLNFSFLRKELFLSVNSMFSMNVDNSINYHNVYKLCGTNNNWCHTKHNDLFVDKKGKRFHLLIKYLNIPFLDEEATKKSKDHDDDFEDSASTKG